MRQTLALILVGVWLVAAPAGGQTPSIVERFLARDDTPLTTYRAARRLTAHNERFKLDGWMEVVTELLPDGRLTWQVLDEGGSEYIRTRVLRAALAGEARTVAAGDPARAALTSDNYVLAPARPDVDGEVPPGLACIRLIPRRADMLLVDGRLWVSATDADLLQVDGRLTKGPSFWTRRVHVVRRYSRIGGVRVPISMQSTADVRIAGTSSFEMTYSYEAINGEAVETMKAASERQP
jgi:hypothetical protein